MIYYKDQQYTDNEFSLILIDEYLNKYFKKTKSAIMEKYSPKVVARLLGEQDISFFCLYYLRDYFVPSDDNSNRNLARVHYQIWEELNNMFVHDKWDKEEFILPRGCSKSTVINKALTTHQHCYKKSRYTIVLGNKEDDAVQFIDDTKQMLQNPRIKEEFGILVNKRERTVNKQELELTNDTKIQAFSWGSSVRGTTYGCLEGIFRPTLIVADDVLKEDDILSDDAKEKTINKYYKEVLEVGDKPVYRNGEKIKSASKFLVIGTPLAQGDFINTIKEDPSFKVFHRQVCNFDVDEYFKKNIYWQEFKAMLFDTKRKDRQERAFKYYEKNKKLLDFTTIWEKYNCLDLAITYFTKRLAFMQELQCDCEQVGDIWIENMMELRRADIENRVFDKTILTVDQASANTSKADYYGFTVLGKSANLYFVRRGELRKYDSKTEFELYINKVISLVKQYPEITHIVLEKNTYKGVDATRIEEQLAADKLLKDRDIEVKLVYNTKNKNDRIATITDKINSGQVVFSKEDELYNKQVRSFKCQKYSLHDDAIDSLEMAINNIDELDVVHNITLFDRSKLGL